MSGIYEYEHFDVDPRSGELRLWISRYGWFKSWVNSGLLTGLLAECHPSYKCADLDEKEKEGGKTEMHTVGVH